MRTRSIISLLWGTVGAALAFQVLVPGPAAAVEPEERQAGEDRWVPSLAVTTGVHVQSWDGFGDSTILEGGVGPAVPLRGSVSDDDLAVEPFVGGTLELMTPALPLLARARFFVSAGLLPTFASKRSIALEGDPECVRGPQPGAPCAVTETEPREFGTAFGQDSANGVGTRTTAEMDWPLYTADVGVAFPFTLSGRHLRLKPSFGWVHYEVEGTGTVVNAACQPATRCVDEENFLPGFPPVQGFLRTPDIITASDALKFHGIGPGIDLEMDAARFGWLGMSLFAGARAYYILGDRTFDFGATQLYDDEIGMDEVQTQFEVEVDDWMYRAHVGIRFQWLGGS